MIVNNSRNKRRPPARTLIIKAPARPGTVKASRRGDCRYFQYRVHGIGPTVFTVRYGFVRRKFAAGPARDAARHASLELIGGGSSGSFGKLG